MPVSRISRNPGVPLFMQVVDDFVAFLGDAPLVIHNAAFDIGFLNAELERLGRSPIARERMIDTLLIARRKHPGGSNRLDDLCARYGIDNSRRTKQGALLDAEILAEVYVELIGARQAQLGLAERGERARSGKGAGIGAGVGAAAGLAAVLFSRGPDAEMPRGTTLEAVLDRPIFLDADKVQFSSPGQASTLPGPPNREPQRKTSPF